MLVGTTCTKPGVVGIFAPEGSAWRLVGPQLPGSLAARPTSVLRLAGTGTGLAGLVEVGTGASAALVGTWSTPGTGRRVLSPALPLAPGVDLRSSGFTPGGGIVALTADGRSRPNLEVVGGPGGWRSLLPPPPDTAAVAVAPGGMDALSAHSTTLTVWHLETNARAWSKIQTMDVPIQFGSSE